MAKKKIEKTDEEKAEKDLLHGGFDKARGFWSDFKNFAMKGNAVDLAIGIVIGSAFTAIVNSLVKDIIMPIFGRVTSNLDFSNIFINISSKYYETLSEAEAAGAAVIKIGAFINAMITFFIVAFALFLILKVLFRQQKKKEEVKEKTQTCPECLEKINLKAKRCKFCTAVQASK
jgi:large conductance mechanosensitive channel